MTTSVLPKLDPRISAAVDELKGLIANHFPVARFDVFEGEDPEGIYLRAVVDIDDPDEVIDLTIDRLMALDLEDGLPLYVIPVRTPERREAMLAAQRSGWPSSSLSIIELD